MSPRVTAIHPLCAIEGGRITIEGTGFPVDGPSLPEVRVGELRGARRLRLADAAVGDRAGRPRGRPDPGARRRASSDETRGPSTSPRRSRPDCIRSTIRSSIATDNLYVTYSGTRGQQVPVSIFRVRPNGTREPFSSGIVNPTSMAIDPEGRLYVSSRFEGAVYRVSADGTPEPFAHRSRRRLRAGVLERRDALCRRSIRHDLQGRPERAGDDVRVAAGERRGVSPRVRSGRGALRHGADAVVVRRAVSHRARRHGDDAVRQVRPAAGARLRSPTARCSSSRRWPARAASIACRRAAPPELVLAGPGLVGVAFDAAGSDGRRVERHRLPAHTVRLRSWSGQADTTEIRTRPRSRSGSRTLRSGRVRLPVVPASAGPDTIPRHVPTLSAQADCRVGRGHAGRSRA